MAAYLLGWNVAKWSRHVDSDSIENDKSKDSEQRLPFLVIPKEHAIFTP